MGSSGSQRGQGSSRQSSTETGHEAESADTTTLKVKVENYNTKDTASDSPIGEPVPPATLPSSGTAIGLLDTLLARSRTVQRKLDRMTIPQADVKTVLAREPSMPAGRPVAILDKCLAQSQLLLQKADKLSAKAKAKWRISTHPHQASTVLEQYTSMPRTEATIVSKQASNMSTWQKNIVLPTSLQEEQQLPALLAEDGSHTRQQEEQQLSTLLREAEVVLTASQEEEQQLSTLLREAEVVLPTSHQQFALPTLATANKAQPSHVETSLGPQAAEADKPSHIQVGCLAQVSPAAQKLDKL